jgi:hypothetical protein
LALEITVKKNIGWALLFSAWFLHLGFCDWRNSFTDAQIFFVLHAAKGLPTFVAAIGGLVMPALCIAAGWAFIRGE